MNVQVWHHSGYDIAAPIKDTGIYNYLCFTEDLEGFIKREVVQVGDYKFIPGYTYKKFGTRKKNKCRICILRW